MAQLHDMAAARARQAARDELKAAEAALAEAEALVGEDCGVGVSITLVNRVRQAVRRVVKARRVLASIDPTRSEPPR